MSVFRFYNSLSKQLEDFSPREKQLVTIYSCGPTVYNLAHIGNFRSYIFADLLGRALRLAGFKTRHAVNLTDIDDKTIRAVTEKKADATLSDLNQLTEPYIEAFLEDISSLGIASFDEHPRATQYIHQMVQLVEKLEQQGYAYQQDNSVYYSLERNTSYGKLSHIDLSQVKTGVRYNTDEYNKEDIRDFVLWKAEKEGEPIAFDSPFGRGRPGWHLECSAMIHETFKGPIDIHTGGVDLIFPHHENEIAQSECGYGEPFVSYWLHCEHLLVDGKKMSKSLGNFYTLRDLLTKGLNVYAIRYLLLSVHYRQKLNFTIEAVNQANNTLKKVWHTYQRLQDARIEKSAKADLAAIQKENTTYRENFLASLQEDLNIAKALAVFHAGLSHINSVLDENHNILTEPSKHELVSLFLYFDQVLNILGGASSLNDTGAPEEVLALLAKRNQARKEKNFALSDELRDQIAAAGFTILDTPDGSRVQKK